MARIPPHALVPDSSRMAAATSVIEIDLGALDHNLAALRRLIGPSVKLCCVVKADAYGLGAPAVSRRMQQHGVDMLAVYTAEQAEDLIKAGITLPLLVLMPLRDVRRTDLLYRSLVSGRLHAVVHDADHVREMIGLGEKFSCIVPVHVEIDTGMSRGGLPIEAAESVVKLITANRQTRLAGLMTHFASSDSNDPATRDQFDRFSALVKRLGSLIPSDCLIHAANTHALLRAPRYHLNMVRVGIGWTGYGPESLRDTTEPVPVVPLRPLVRWLSQLVHLKWIEPKTSVGYAMTWTARRRTRVGLVPVGYADGLPIGLSNRGIVRIGTPAGDWLPAPILGRVSMDQITIDLTNAPDEVAAIGAPIEIISNDPAAPNSLPRLAELAGVIPWSILCGLSGRTQRAYRLIPAASASTATMTTANRGVDSSNPPPSLARSVG